MSTYHDHQRITHRVHDDGRVPEPRIWWVALHARRTPTHVARVEHMDISPTSDATPDEEAVVDGDTRVPRARRRWHPCRRWLLPCARAHVEYVQVIEQVCLVTACKQKDTRAEQVGRVPVAWRRCLALALREGPGQRVRRLSRRLHLRRRGCDAHRSATGPKPRHLLGAMEQSNRAAESARGKRIIDPRVSAVRQPVVSYSGIQVSLGQFQESK